MDLVKERWLVQANRALWRLPFSAKGESTRVHRMSAEIAGSCSATAIFGLLFISMVAGRSRLGAVCAHINALTVITGWAGLAAGCAKGSSAKQWDSDQALWSLDRQSRKKDLLFFICRALFSATSIVTTAWSLKRFPSFINKVFVTRSATLEWGALLLSVADLTYWQVHSGRVKQNGRLAWL